MREASTNKCLSGENQTLGVDLIVKSGYFGREPAFPLNSVALDLVDRVMLDNFLIATHSKWAQGPIQGSVAAEFGTPEACLQSSIEHLDWRVSVGGLEE